MTIKALLSNLRNAIVHQPGNFVVCQHMADTTDTHLHNKGRSMLCLFVYCFRTQKRVVMNELGVFAVFAAYS